MKHVYNWKPDLPDHRDLKFSQNKLGLVVNRKAPKLPTQVDLRSFCSPVVDQGQIGSCTGNSLAGHLEFLELKEMREKSVKHPEEFDPSTFSPFSRLFIYYNERVLEGTVNEDSGAQIRDGIKTLNQTGACRESVWAYSDANEFLKPTPAAYQEAQQHQISLYLRIQSLQEMKQCLSQGYPFVFGFTVYQSFEGPIVAKTGKVPMPTRKESSLGGHAVMAVGYDDTKKVFIIRNSWGALWGDNGYFYLPYDYISNSDLADDFWTIRL